MRKILSLILIFCILFSVNVFGLSITYKNEYGETVKINDFLDTQGHWAHDTIWKVADYGLIVGSNGNFMPDQPIKRGDLAIIIDRMLGLKLMSYNYFNDLYNDDYFAESLLKCVAAEYITGVSANQIEPMGYATREQVAVILSRIFDLNSNNYSSSTNFKDDSKISSWARSSVSAMSKLGYVNGDDRGYVNPQSYITRAELVTMLNNIANTYIPKKANTNISGVSEYKNNFPTNVITSRNITFKDSMVSRDLILTPDASSITLNNTVVRGRLLLMANQTINLNQSTVNQIVLLNGKATVYGVNEDINSVRVTLSASESTLDNIPNMLVLDSGARVKINGIMYENESMRTKTYHAADLQADISDEQGYVVGGPKISGAKFEQDMDNTITVSNIRITAGKNDIREIGVIWLEQDDDENAVNPTYKKNDGKKVYRSNKIDELIAFEAGEVEGTCAYRVYVKDKDGLFAYSNSTIFSEYEYSTSLKIYDNNYPEKIDVEVVFRGDSVPDISNVRVVYDIDELYSENHKEVSLRLYSDPDAEYQPDTKKYKRYIGTITSPTERINGEIVYTPPTAFGYIITFRNGTLINRFPILTNAVPDGVSPMANLETGTALYTGGNILNIKGNEVSSRYVVPQEIGVVYKISTNETVSRPTSDASGWTKKSAYVDLDVNESADFNVSIPLVETDGYTHYAAYVKTSNGYWYGDVKKFANNVQGDEGGYKISGINTKCLGDTEVLVEINMDSNYGVPMTTDYIKMGNKGYSTIGDLQGKIYDNKVYVIISDLNNTTDYNIPISIENSANLKSNTVSADFNISKSNDVVIGNKKSDGSSTYYTFILNSNDLPPRIVNAIDVNDENTIYFTDTTININGCENLENTVIKVTYNYKLVSNPLQTIMWKFTKTFKLY